MGVFARLFRRSTTTEEAPAGETRADTPAADPTAAEPVTVESVAEEAATTTGPAGAGTGETAERAARSTPDAGSESVGIPQQQTAGDAATEAADKSART